MQLKELKTKTISNIKMKFAFKIFQVYLLYAFVIPNLIMFLFYIIFDTECVKDKRICEKRKTKNAENGNHRMTALLKVTFFLFNFNLDFYWIIDYKYFVIMRVLLSIFKT